MGRTILMVKSNLRRMRGQTAAIVVLLLLASAMMNLWLMISMDYKGNFKRCHERLNAGHVTLVMDGRGEELREFLAGVLDDDARTVQYDMADVMSMVGMFSYNGGEVNTEFVIMEKEAAMNRSLERIEIVEEGAYTSGVYLPMLYHTNGGYETGDTIHLTIGYDTTDYTVCGFLNSAMLGSHNCSMSALLFTADCYEELEQKGIAPAATMVSIWIRDPQESDAYEAALKNEVSAEYPEARTLSNSYVLVSSSRYISQMICAGIVSAMACFVILIALVVISSGVSNDIQETMRDLGALKAIGYQSGQMIRTLLLQYASLSLLTSLAGIGLSYCIFPALNGMMISQTGIPYAMRFLPAPFLITIVLTAGAVLLAVWLSARKIKKIEPVTALRQGIQTHSFRRNHVPLPETKLPLLPALALKSTCAGIRQNITVCVTMLVLSLVVVFSGLMVENMIVDMQPFIDMIVGETADSCININAEDEEEFLRLMREDARVEKVYLWHSEEVRCVGDIALIATMSDDFSQANNPKVCIEGRYPVYENEVAIAIKYAGEHGLATGDLITLTADGNEAEYIISGFTQLSNNLGKDCLLTREGYERMGEMSNESYYINVAEGTDIDAFQEEVSDRMYTNATINIQAVINGTSSVYVSLMTIIVIAILILSGAVITFVLYLLVRTVLRGKMRDYGIQKALGFTTGQLICQTALGFFPAIAISTFVGIVVSAAVINPLTALFLRGIGIVTCTFAVPVRFIAVAGAGMVIFAFLMTCLLSLRIRKISPAKLLCGE